MRQKVYVNTDKLNEYIEKSGLRINFIVEKLGISRNAFDLKRKGVISFRVSEVYVLCDLLRISDPDEKEKIFYPESQVIAEPA